MQRPADAISFLLALTLSLTAAFVAMSAPGPAVQAGGSEALRAMTVPDAAPVSSVRLLIALLPAAALVTRLTARRGVWR